MKNLVLLLFLHIVLLPITVGQVGHSTCGTTVSPEFYHLLCQQAKEINEVNASNKMTTCTITIQPHIVRVSIGVGGLTVAELNTSIQQLNQAYAQVGFHFMMNPPNYIDNDAYYIQMIADSPNEFNMANPNIDATMVNVFFAPNAGFMFSTGFFPSNWASLPHDKVYRNWIVMNNRFATDGETLAHEVGHYFNLLHTHANTIVEKVTRDVTDNCYNADTAGDLVSDTPADHDLSTWTTLQVFNIDGVCNYIGNENDNCLPPLAYAPDTRNIMSYAIIDTFSIGCRTSFSQGQIDRMVYAFNNLRPELNTSCSGSPCTVSTTPSNANVLAGVGYAWTMVGPSTSGSTWTASTTATWISLDTTSGAGNSFLGFTISPNNGPARIDSICVRCSGGPCSYITVNQAAGITPITCNISAWLEGVYEMTNSTMKNTLQQFALLPAGQPYSGAPWNYNGTEGGGWLPSDYPAGSIDWVLLSLRTTDQANTEVGKGAGLLMEDGSIINASIELTGTPASQYYIVLEHRNHLPAMTPVAIPLVNNTLTYDFRLSNSYNQGGFGQKPIGSQWMLFAGNIDQSSPVGNEVNGADVILWQAANGNFGAYLEEDSNMDGDVNGIDRVFMNKNNGISSGVKK